MLHNVLHPEKITKGDQGFVIEIMKDRHVFGQVNDLFMNKTTDVVHRFY
jgi:hypothetical protein